MCPTWRKWPIAKSWQSAYTLCKKIEMLWQWRQSRSFWAQMFQLELQYLQWCLPHENRICSLATEPRFNMLQLLENGIESEQKHEQLLYFSWAINSRNDFVYSGPYSTEQSAAKWSSHWSLLGKNRFLRVNDSIWVCITIYVNHSLISSWVWIRSNWIQSKHDKHANLSDYFNYITLYNICRFMLICFIPFPFCGPRNVFAQVREALTLCGRAARAARTAQEPRWAPKQPSTELIWTVSHEDHEV